MKLKVGDIVKVVNEECHRYGKQGQVVGFNLDNKENPLRVWFDKASDILFDWEKRNELGDKYAITAPTEADQSKDPRTWDYAESDLKKELEWSMKTLVERHFHNFYQAYFEPKKPFVAGAHDCDVKRCRKTTTQRIIYNVWGSVCFADVCDEHAKEFNLKSMDSFPLKER